eukprot:scaffold171_cov263-Pinguiococcus_pyrenoidosus.AAC.6
MASCYGVSGVLGDGKKGIEVLEYLPLQVRLKDGSLAQCDFFQTADDIERGAELLNDILDDGLYWPYWHAFGSQEEFQSYFLSDTAVRLRESDVPTCATADSWSPGTSLPVVHAKETGFRAEGDERDGLNGASCDFPRQARGRGVAQAMGKLFLRVAKDVGFRWVLQGSFWIPRTRLRPKLLRIRAAYFNLVFVTNQASIAVWRKLGFVALARVPKVAKLKGINGAIQDSSPFVRGEASWQEKEE